MLLTQIYAIAAGGLVLGLLLARIWKQYTLSINLFVSRYLTYPCALPRLGYVGPWTPADIIMQAVYVALNILCVTLGAASTDDIQKRAGTLTIINIMPLFFGSHIVFAADLLGLTLSDFKRIHRCAGGMVFALFMLRAIIDLYSPPNSTNNAILVLVSLEFMNKYCSDI